MTISCGVAVRDPDAPIRQVLREADAAGYWAKRAGGNRVDVHETLTEDT